MKTLEQKKKIEGYAELLVDSHYGIYTPVTFYEEWNSQITNQMVGSPIVIKTNVDNQTWEDISNVENEFYWDSWEMVLNNCQIFSGDTEYFLCSNEDLWAVPVECMDQLEDWMI